jgi:hypothetical protein
MRVKNRRGGIKKPEQSNLFRLSFSWRSYRRDTALTIGLMKCLPAARASPHSGISKHRHRTGIEEFIFSGCPHLEESYRVAELLFPLLPLERPPVPQSNGNIRASGEVIAHNLYAQTARA